MSVNEYILVIFKNHKHKAKYFLKAKKDILHAVTYIHWFFITLTIISFVTVLSLQFFFIAVLAYQKCSMFLPLKFLLYSDWVIDVNTLQWLSYPILFFFFFKPSDCRTERPRYEMCRNPLTVQAHAHGTRKQESFYYIFFWHSLLVYSCKDSSVRPKTSKGHAMILQVSHPFWLIIITKLMAH